MKRFIAVLSVFILLASSLLPAGVASADSLNNHAIVLDSNGKIIPWTTSPTDGYDTAAFLSMDYIMNKVPNDPVTGKPAYLSRSKLDANSQTVMNWPNNPAGMFGMLIDSSLRYYAYSGNAQCLTFARSLADHMLANGMTPSNYNWGTVPNSSGEYGSLTYNGSSYGDGHNGQGDGTAVIEPDKVAEMSVAWINLYKVTGDTRYRDAAINGANELAEHIRVGSATQSPWPFRVKSQTNVVVQNYGANVIAPIELFDSLIALNLGDVTSYQTTRAAAWSWLMTYPMQNNKWDGYFEDMPNDPNITNNNQLNAGNTAIYLMEHPEMDPQWETHTRGIISFIKNTFGQTEYGATSVNEQTDYDKRPMGSHTSRYATVNAMLYERTGDATAKEEAYRSYNWATYMARSNGVVIDGPAINEIWFTDGYGDYIKHFTMGMGAVPEWAPSGKTHLLETTASVVTSVTYNTGGVQYTTAEPSATDTLKLNFAPVSVTAGGIQLTQNSNLNQEGWTYNSTTGVLRIRHDTSGSIQIVSGTPSNQPPTVSLTSPTSGASFTEGNNITLNATASDSDGTVTKVEFYNGSTLLGTDTSAPYSYTWNNVPAGSYNLTAVATDNGNATASTLGTNITVNPPSNLPSPWNDGDIGSVGVAGSAGYSSSTGTFTVRGSGVDIWDAADSFHYVYQPLNGDGTITARVAGIQNTDPWALAGVMIRENLTAGSREAIAAVTPGNGIAFTWRPTANAASSYTNGNAGTAPYWVRLQRSGNTFTAFKSTNGTTWTQYATATIAMGTNAYVGLAVTSHNNGVLATDTFDNVTVTSSSDTTAPTISNVIASGISQNGATIGWTTNEASDSQVEYGLNTGYGSSTTLNASFVTAHSATLTGLDPATTYHYRVKSKDAAGNLATSGDNTFTTTTPPDTQAPSKPTGLVADSVNSNRVELSWFASTDNVGVAGYRIYRNGVQIDTVGVAGYSDTTVSPNTTYQYTVAGYDAAGNVGPQADSITVTTPQLLDFIAPTAPASLNVTAGTGPKANLSWTASTDNVGVTGYEIWRDGNLLTTVTGTSYSDAAVSAGETHDYYVKAYDAASNTSVASNTASVTIPTPDTQAPSVPANLNATATSSTAINLSWTASTDNVGVTGYRVFRNGTQVGTTSSTSYTDTGLAASTSYNYTVRAYDAAGNVSADSNIVSVTTQAAPSGVAVDKSVVIKQTTASTSLTAPSFSTTAPNELLVAFIASDGPNNGSITISGVTGGGLTWTLAKRVNTQRGTAEIWTAVATSVTSNISVKATHTGSYQGMMQVVAFQNAKLGTTGGANAATGAASASLTTTAANAWVWGVGNDWDDAVARTLGSGQTKENELLAPAGDTFWVQRQTNMTSNTGTNVTLNATAPTNDRWNLATVEIVPR